MRISLVESYYMFDLVNVDREQLHKALRGMAIDHLKPKLRKEWHFTNPTKNFCYVVSEWLFHYVLPEGSTAYRLQIPGYDVKHYFCRLPNKKVIDLTAEQFDDYENVLYENAKKATFMYPSPSKRARVLATQYGPVQKMSGASLF